MSAAEDEVDGVVTLDTAYGEIGFGSISSGTGGLPQTNIRARVGTLANTSTGDTFDHGAVTASDRATILVRLEEAPLKVLPSLVMANYWAPTSNEPY
jgi:hypothetical protein